MIEVKRDYMTSSSSPELRVLVTGVGGPAGKAATFFFKDHNVFVLGTDVRALDTEADHFQKIPPGLDTAFIPAIISLIKRFNISLLISTVTEELLSVSQARSAIKKCGCFVFSPSPKYIRIANDKFLTVKYLNGHGIQTPQSIEQEKLDSLDNLAEAIEFPILAKPRFSRGGRGLSLYAAKEDLIKEKRNGLVFQEFIPGEEYNTNVFAYPRGEIMVNAVLLKTALKNGIFGNALSVKRAHHPEVEKVSAQAVRALKLEGPADIDIRLKSDGSPVLLEVNARVGANVLSAQEVLEKMVSTWTECFRKDVR